MKGRSIYIFVGIGVLFCIYWIQLTLRYPVSYDITEGVLFHRALLLANGENIYPFIKFPPYFVTPYTPLSVILIAGLIKLFGPILWLGRIVSALAFFGTIFAAAHIVKERCGSYLRSLGFMLLLLCSYHVISNAFSFSMQWMGIFFSILGLALLQKRPYLAFFVMSVGIITKQSQLLAPLAALVWLAGKDWRDAFECGIFFGCCVALELIGLSLIFGHNFFDHTLTYTVGTYHLLNLARLAGYCLAPYFIFIIIGGIIVYRRFKAAAADLLVIYFLINSLWLFAAARLGSDSKYFLEFYVALFLLIAPFVISNGRFVRLAVVSQLVMLCIFTLFMLHWNGKRVIERDIAFNKVISVLKNLSGDIIVEDPSLAVMSGHRLFLEAFPMSELARKGLWDQRSVVDGLKKGEYPAVVLQFDVNKERLYFTAKERFTGEMREAVRFGYEVQDKIGPFYLYRPKGNKL